MVAQAPLHNDKIQEKGEAGPEHWALVHAPVKFDDAMRIPEAKQAIQKEFDKLHKKTSFDFNTVEEN